MKFLTCMLSFSIIVLLSCKEEIPLECVPSELKSGLVAYYPFIQGDVTDESGSDFNLEHVGGILSPVVDRFGNKDCAMSFEDSNLKTKYLKAADSTVLAGLQNFSISMWYFGKDKDREPNKYEILIQKGVINECPEKRGEWSVGLYDCRQALFMENNVVWQSVEDPNNPTCQEITNSLSEKWNHIAAVKNGDSYKIYYNGVLKASADGNLWCSNIDSKVYSELVIGKNLNGFIDEVMIYNRALSANEILQIMDLEVCCGNV